MEKELERFEQFSFSIFEISHFWHQLTAQEMEKHGLKGSHTLYLLTLYRYPEGISSKDLGRICGRDKADVSRMLSSLEAMGYVRKEGIHQRLYGGTFKLTEAGLQLTVKLRKRVEQAVDCAGAGLTDTGRTAFYNALQTIHDNVRQMAEEGFPEAPSNSEATKEE